MTNLPEGQQFLKRSIPSSSYEVIARSRKVAKDWEEFANKATSQCAEVYDRLEKNPDTYESGRQHELKGSTGQGNYNGLEYTRWQIDVASGGRVWYFIDRISHGQGKGRRAGTVMFDAVYMGHPKSTMRKPTGKSRPGRR